MATLVVIPVPNSTVIRGFTVARGQERNKKKKKTKNVTVIHVKSKKQTVSWFGTPGGEIRARGDGDVPREILECIFEANFFFRFY